LKPAEITFDSLAAGVNQAWARQLPADAQPSRLDRVEVRAPLPSFAIVRQPVGIIRAQAGSNSGDASASFDDDESTAWTSTGEIADAWIEYELERPANLSEVTLKLSGWRERAYPMRILVDGIEVWRDATRRNLGYVTLPLKSARGSRVRLELLDATAAQDAFNITELEDQRNSATGATRIRASALSIVETEVYEFGAGG
jgi:hypothetical protein